jgi:hypothetical protein
VFVRASSSPHVEPLSATESILSLFIRRNLPTRLQQLFALFILERLVSSQCSTIRYPELSPSTCPTGGHDENFYPSINQSTRRPLVLSMNLTTLELNIEQGLDIMYAASWPARVRIKTSGANEMANDRPHTANDENAHVNTMATRWTATNVIIGEWKPSSTFSQGRHYQLLVVLRTVTLQVFKTNYKIFPSLTCSKCVR